MPETLARHIEFLYGRDRTAGLVEQITALAAKHKLSIPPALTGEGRSRLTQRDALLITYADQVREPSCMPLVTLAKLLEEHCRGVLSGVHLLPFYPSSSDDGFAVEDFFAIDPAVGDWPDVARLGSSLDLMFDAVFNHMSARSGWFRAFLRGEQTFRDFFVTVHGDPDLSDVVRPRTLPLLTEFAGAAGAMKVWTTFSADQVDLNFANPRVLLAVIDALLFYVTKGARFIRLDAIAFLWKEIGTSCLHLPRTHRIIQVLRHVLDMAAPKVLLITETNVPHAENLSYFGDGSNEAQLVYNFALPPLVLHSFAAGNTWKLTRWAQSLSLPSGEVTFFNFLASHDGIGLNPARGILDASEIQALVARTTAHGGFISHKAMPDGSQAPYEMNINYFDALSNPRADEAIDRQVARAVCAHGLMLSFPGVPGIYFHSLFGSRGDRAGAETSGIPRRINREKLSLNSLQSALANPLSIRAKVFRGLGHLLAIRKEHEAFEPYGAFEALAVDPRIFAIVRMRPGQTSVGDGRLLCLHNVSAETVEVDLKLVKESAATRWSPLVGAEPGLDGRLRLPPFCLSWLKAAQ